MNRVVGGAALISKTCARTVSSTAVRRSVKPDLAKLKKKQIHFQVENDAPVFLKGGPMDQMLHVGTWLLTIGGLILSTQALYQLSKK